MVAESLNRLISIQSKLDNARKTHIETLEKMNLRQMHMIHAQREIIEKLQSELETAHALIAKYRALVNELKG